MGKKLTRGALASAAALTTVISLGALAAPANAETTNPSALAARAVAANDVYYNTLQAHTLGTIPAPMVSYLQTGNGGVNFTLATQPSEAGKTVVFFYISGVTGIVRSMGSAVIGSDGAATHFVQAKHGQIIKYYAKVLSAPEMSTPYSNIRAMQVL